MPVPAAGWYDDPEKRHQSRFWDGRNWTARVADDGVESHEPIPEPPAWFKRSRMSAVEWSATPPFEGWVREGRQWVDPTKHRSGLARWWSARQGNEQLLIIIGVVVLLIAIPVVVSGLASSDRRDGSDLEFAAFDVCRQFVKERLRAPATAEFPDPTEDDGEVRIARNGERVFIVMSQVDSENGFGALLTTPFRCEVRHIEDTRFRLVDLELQE